MKIFKKLKFPKNIFSKSTFFKKSTFFIKNYFFRKKYKKVQKCTFFQNFRFSIFKFIFFVEKNISEKILKIRINKTLTNPEESVGHLLTPEEKYILEPLLSGSRRNIKLLRAINDGHIEFLTSLEEHDVNSYIAVKFLEDTPSTVGIDSRTYGPFKEDDIAILPTDNAKPLLIQKKSKN